MSTSKVPKANPRPLRIAIYARMSKDRTGAGLGIDRQVDVCRRNAKKMGGTVVGVYTDNDIGASSGKKPRPGYQRLLADIRSGLIDVVLVWHTDRLHRRPIELEEFIQAAESQKPNVNVLADQAGILDLSTPAGRMIARQLAAVAKYEGELKAERQKAADLQRAQAGLPCGGRRAFGFMSDQIAHEPSEAKLLRAAYKSVLDGESLNSIARTWNAAGVYTVEGLEHIGTSVGKILRAPRNAGLRVYQGEVIGKAVWKPIVSEDVWRAAHAILVDPGRKKTPGPKPKHLLAGILLCGYEDEHGEQCVYTMKSALTDRPGNAQRRYRCRGFSHLSRTAEPIDDFVQKLAIARLQEPDARDLLIPAGEVDLSELHAEARTLRGRQKALAKQAVAGGITPLQMAEMNQQFGEQLEEIEAQIVDLAQTHALAAMIDGEDVEKRWYSDTMTLDRRRAVIDALMVVTLLPVGKGAAVFDPTTSLRIEWRKPGAKLTKGKSRNQAALNPAPRRSRKLVSA